MGDVIQFTIAKKVRSVQRCNHFNIVFVEDGHFLQCDDCGSYVDPIQLVIDIAKKKRDIKAHRARERRPVEVTELCGGKANTARRRDTLRSYLMELEGCNFVKYKFD